MTIKASGTTLVHSVYFALKDKSALTIEHFIAQCDKYLTDHPGIEYYFAGRHVPDLNRPVNDHRFDVALLVVFKDRASHDIYQKSDMHCEFMEKNRDNWEEVRVFDAAAAQA